MVYIPKVSVIIPIYNVEKYLDRCVQSVRNQTLKDIEIILVDDGSPDGCPEMCDEYVRQDSRIKVVHKENGGLGFARNSGLDVATGEYVAFVDSDDFVDLNMYERLFYEATEHNADVVYSNVKFNNNGNISVRKDVESPMVLNGREKVEEFLLDMVAPLPQSNRDVKYMASVWRAVYRTKIIKEYSISFLSERVFVSEDIPFNIEFLKYSACVVYLDEAFYNYCYNSSSLSKTPSFAKYDKMGNLLVKIKEQLSSIFPESRYMLHYQRYVLFVLRISLFGDWQICKSENIKWRKQFEKRRKRKEYESVMDSYPINDMPLKFRLFYLSVKGGLYLIVDLIFRLTKSYV